MDINRVQGKSIPSGHAFVPRAEVSALEGASEAPCSSLQCGDRLEKGALRRLKSKWRDFKQFYNVDTPPEQIGVTSKKNLFHFTKQLVARTCNSLGSAEKGCKLQGRFLVFSSWDHRLHSVLSGLGLHRLANLIDLSVDDVEGKVNYEVRITDGAGRPVAVRDGEADGEGMFNLSVAFSQEEKKKIGDAKRLGFQVYFRGIEDEKDEYAHFNRERNLDVPVGGGVITLLKKGGSVVSSDIDKTIIDTSIGMRYFSGEPWEREFMPGAAPLFRALSETLHALSGSEQNVSTGILAAFELHGVNPAATDFKDWGGGEGEAASIKKQKLTDQVGFKLTRELETDIHLPGNTALYGHGDITEYDPIVYLLLHGLRSGDITPRALEEMFRSPEDWPQLRSVPPSDRQKLVALASLMEKGPGLSLININIGAGSPDRPPLKNVHGFSLDDFIAFADKLEGFRPGCNNYRDRIIFSDNYLQTALYYRQSGDSRITDDVVVEVGRDLRSRGFTRSQVAASLRKVLTDERGRTPRAFLDPGGVREIAPKLRAAGIVPRGFLA